jgi:hypothetical protein
MADRWGDLAYAVGGWSRRRDGRNGRFVDGPRNRWKPNLKIIKAIIQFVIKTMRFQPKATIAEDIKVAEEAGVAEGAGVAEETEESDDESEERSL